MTIFTIGYEGLNLEAFMQLLQEHDIETIVDVRELPLSRKPGFSKKSLSTALQFSGFRYLHMVELGCPRAVRNRYREDGDWAHYTEGFLAYLETQKAAIAKLAVEVRLSNCALLCYEADYRQCHRSMVANAVQEYCGAAIQHVKNTAIKKVAFEDRQLALA